MATPNKAATDEVYTMKLVDVKRLSPQQIEELAQVSADSRLQSQKAKTEVFRKENEALYSFVIEQGLVDEFEDFFSGKGAGNE